MPHQSLRSGEGRGGLASSIAKVGGGLAPRHLFRRGGTGKQPERWLFRGWGRTRGADAAASVARAEVVLGVLEGSARERFKRDLCDYSAEGGHLAVLQWARAHGCPRNEWTCTEAASNGHLEVLQWARAQGCDWGERTCARAAEGGHLEVLQWARAHGRPWDEWTCAEAARHGHLEVLQWARAHGCPW